MIGYEVIDRMRSSHDCAVMIEDSWLKGGYTAGNISVIVSVARGGGGGGGV